MLKYFLKFIRFSPFKSFLWFVSEIRENKNDQLDAMMIPGPVDPVHSIFSHLAPTPPRERAYIVDDSIENVADHFYEIGLIMGGNEGALFNCMQQTFNADHIALFLGKFPEILHKRLCLYIIRIFASSVNVDDIIEVILKPATKLLYPDYPLWLKELSFDGILDTLAIIQKEVGGHQKLQEEFELMKKEFLRSSNEISAKNFLDYVESNPAITEIYGFIDQSRLSFLDNVGSVTHSGICQRHLKVKQGTRTIHVHLFGCDYVNSFSLALRAFAIENGLKVPANYDDPRESSHVDIATVKNSDKVKMAYHFLCLWWEKFNLDQCNENALVSWFLFDSKSNLIETFEQFQELAEMAKHSPQLPNFPDRQTFKKIILARAAKKYQSLANTTVFSNTLSHATRSEKVKRFTDLLIKSSWFKPIPFFFVNADEAGIDLALSKLTNRNPAILEETSVKLPWWRMTLALHSHVRKEFERFRFSYNPSLIDLLPISENPLSPFELSIALQKYLDLIRLAEEALGKFKQRELKYFNPLVGENACQIRALLLSEILNKQDIDEIIANIQKGLEAHKNHLQTLLRTIPNKQELMSFRKFLQEHHELFYIPEELVTIISSFILTDTKDVYYQPNEQGIPVFVERLPVEKLMMRRNLTKKYAADLIKTAQRKLAEVSVIYIQRLALRRLSNKQEKASAALAFSLVKTDTLQRNRVPFFPTMRLLLTEIHHNRIPLVLKIKQFIAGQKEHYGKSTLIFCNQGQGRLTLLTKPAHLFKKGAVSFEVGSVTKQRQSIEILKNQILKTQIEDYILSAAADHPHFECQDSELANTSIEEYRQKALELGACHANPRVFMVLHVRCKTIEQKLIDRLPNL